MITETTSRHLRRLRKNWFIAFVSVVLAVTGVYIVTLSAAPNIEITGTKYRTEAQYLDKTQAVLQANMLNRVKPTLQRAKIEQELKKQFPEAKSITVTAPLLGRRAVVAITMDEPAAVLKQANSQDLIISQRGRLLLTANQSSATTDLPVITNESTVAGKEGEQFLRPDDMKSLLQVFEQIELSGSSASYIVPIQPREFIMIEPGRGAYQVRFLFGDTVLDQFGSLRAAQKKLQELGQTPAQYIDVRLANKVFYQ